MRVAHKSQNARRLDGVGGSFKLLQRLAVIFERARIISLQSSDETNASQRAADRRFHLFEQRQAVEVVFQRQTVVTARPMYVSNPLESVGQPELIRLVL